MPPARPSRRREPRVSEERLLGALDQLALDLEGQARRQNFTPVPIAQPTARGPSVRGVPTAGAPTPTAAEPRVSALLPAERPRPGFPSGRPLAATVAPPGTPQSPRASRAGTVVGPVPRQPTTFAPYAPTAPGTPRVAQRGEGTRFAPVPPAVRPTPSAKTRITTPAQAVALLGGLGLKHLDRLTSISGSRLPLAQAIVSREVDPAHLTAVDVAVQRLHLLPERQRDMALREFGIESQVMQANMMARQQEVHVTDLVRKAEALVEKYRAPELPPEAPRQPTPAPVARVIDAVAPEAKAALWGAGVKPADAELLFGTGNLLRNVGEAVERGALPPQTVLRLRDEINKATKAGGREASRFGAHYDAGLAEAEQLAETNPVAAVEFLLAHARRGTVDEERWFAEGEKTGKKRRQGPSQREGTLAELVAQLDEEGEPAERQRKRRSTLLVAGLPRQASGVAGEETVEQRAARIAAVGDSLLADLKAKPLKKRGARPRVGEIPEGTGEWMLSGFGESETAVRKLQKLVEEDEDLRLKGTWTDTWRNLTDFERSEAVRMFRFLSGKLSPEKRAKLAVAINLLRRKERPSKVKALVKRTLAGLTNYERSETLKMIAVLRGNAPRERQLTPRIAGLPRQAPQAQRSLLGETTTLASLLNPHVPPTTRRQPEAAFTFTEEEAKRAAEEAFALPPAEPFLERLARAKTAVVQKAGELRGKVSAKKAQLLEAVSRRGGAARTTLREKAGRAGTYLAEDFSRWSTVKAAKAVPSKARALALATRSLAGEQRRKLTDYERSELLAAVRAGRLKYAEVKPRALQRGKELLEAVRRGKGAVLGGGRVRGRSALATAREKAGRAGTYLASLGTRTSQRVRDAVGAYYRAHATYPPVLDPLNGFVSPEHVDLELLPSGHIRVNDFHRKGGVGTVIRRGTATAPVRFRNDVIHEEFVRPLEGDDFFTVTGGRIVHESESRKAEVRGQYQTLISPGHVVRVGLNELLVDTYTPGRKLVLRGVDGPVRGLRYVFDAKKKDKVTIGNRSDADIALIHQALTAVKDDTT